VVEPIIDFTSNKQ